MSGLPAFLSQVRHGAIALSPPAQFTGVTSYAFVFKANKIAMQQRVDAALNAVCRDALNYKVLGGACALSFMDMQKCSSLVDIVGWLPGRECALWIPLVEHGGTGGPRLVLWAPYIFINYEIGMVTGREVWGWPKSLATINMPGDGPLGKSLFLSCTTTVFDTLSATTRGEERALLTLTGGLTEPPGRAIPPGPAACDLFDRLFAGAPAEWIAAFRLRAVAVVLKQFQDSNDHRLACFQAIVESPIELAKLPVSAQLLGGSFTLTISNCESHQIACDLFTASPGRETVVVTTDGLLLNGFDFRALPGRVLFP